MNEPSLLDNSSEPQTEVLDPNKSYVEQLVGPDRKYKDMEEVAKGKYFADIHIKTLETRFDQLREDFMKEREVNANRTKLEELISKLETQPGLPGGQSAGLSPQQPAQQEQSIKPDDIKSMFDQSINQYERRKTGDQNFSTVKTKLIERYGNNYQNAYKERIEQLGLTPERADALARETPQAVITMLGLDVPVQRETYTPPPQSSGAFRPQSKKTLRYSDFVEMRKKDPKLYYDPKINNEMDRLSQEQGDAFFDI